MRLALTLAALGLARALNLGLMMRLSTNTSGSTVPLGDQWTTVAVAALWAVKLFNERPATNDLVGNLTASGLSACPGLALNLTNQTRTIPSVSDTRSLPRVATDRFLAGAYRPNATCTFADPAWHAIIGPARSACSTPVAMLGGIESVLSTSFWSTSPDLENQDEYPYFTRTIAQDDSTILAIMSWIAQNDWSRVGLLYIKDTWGSGFATSLSREFSARSMELVSQSFNEGDGASIGTAIGQLASQRVKVVLCLNFDGDFATIVDRAVESELLGDADHHWIFGTTQQWSSLTASQAAAIDGSAEVAALGGVSTHAPWAALVDGWAGLSPADFNPLLPGAFQLDAGFFHRTAGSIHDLAAYSFDAVAAVGLAACRAAPATDTPALYRALTGQWFEGVSGTVRFTGNGSRTFGSSNFFLFNVRQTGRRAGLESAVVRGYDHATGEFAAGCGLCGSRQFAFWGGALSAPSDRWPTDDDDDQTLAIALGASLGGAVLVGAVGFAVYWWWTRSKLRGMEQQLEEMERALVGVVKLQYPCMPGVAAAQWWWQEDEARLARHPTNRVQAPCWVRYEPTDETGLEDAYQSREARYKTGTYEVELDTLDRGVADAVADKAQTKLVTGYKRGVRRCGPVAGVDHVVMHVGAADDVPADLADQPRLVVGQDALVQISRRRDDDDWVYASVLHAEDQVRAPDDEAFSVQAGWLPESLTIEPTREELRVLADAMGGGSLDAPGHWQVEEGADPGVAVLRDVPLDSPEVAEILAKFGETVDRRFVRRVRRVQNLAMYQSYLVRRKTMEARGDMDLADLEVPIMFHGSNDETVPKIIQQGFNRSFAGKNAVRFGKGCYFAYNASYSCHRTYAVPDKKGVQYVFAASVLKGWSCLGRDGQLVPDVRIADKNILYDTTIDDRDQMVVVFYDNQAYPGYLLEIAQT